MEYFKKLLDLLKIEKEEDQNAYLKLTASSSVAVQRSAEVIISQ
jgi:ATP-dependent RNA/DNA helicase IGHMBP2